MRDGLLGAQIAICTLLVTASFVAVRGMVRLLHTPLGFHPQGALLAEIDLSEQPGGDVPLAEKQAMIEAVRRHPPGWTPRARSAKPPSPAGCAVSRFSRRTRPSSRSTTRRWNPYVFTASPCYLETAGTRLLAGRDVSWHDTAQTPFAAVVNATFARPGMGQRSGTGPAFHPVKSPHGSDRRGGGRQVLPVAGSPAAGPCSCRWRRTREPTRSSWCARPTRQNELAPALARALHTVEPERAGHG